MVHVNGNRAVALLGSVQGRLSRIQSRLKFAKLSAVIWLAFALGLGCWAYRESTTNAIEAWIKANRPGLSAWSLALRALGFIRVENALLLERILRDIPEGEFPEESVWVSADWAGVVFYASDSSEEAGFQPMVFVSASFWQRYGKLRPSSSSETLPRGYTKLLPKSWNQHKASWSGFNDVINLLVARPKDSRAQILEKAKPESRDSSDPREIRY